MLMESGAHDQIIIQLPKREMQDFYKVQQESKEGLVLLNIIFQLML